MLESILELLKVEGHFYAIEVIPKNFWYKCDAALRALEASQVNRVTAFFVLSRLHCCLTHHSPEVLAYISLVTVYRSYSQMTSSVICLLNISFTSTFYPVTKNYAVGMDMNNIEDNTEDASYGCYGEGY